MVSDHLSDIDHLGLVKHMENCGPAALQISWAYVIRLPGSASVQLDELLASCVCLCMTGHVSYLSLWFHCFAGSPCHYSEPGSNTSPPAGALFCSKCSCASSHPWCCYWWSSHYGTTERWWEGSRLWQGRRGLALSLQPRFRCWVWP